MGLPVEKQANTLQGIFNYNVTFAEEENVIFVGEVLDGEEIEQAKRAISAEDVYNPDDKVTRIDVVV